VRGEFFLKKQGYSRWGSITKKKKQQDGKKEIPRLGHEANSQPGVVKNLRRGGTISKKKEKGKSRKKECSHH